MEDTCLCNKYTDTFSAVQTEHFNKNVDSLNSSTVRDKGKSGRLDFLTLITKDLTLWKQFKREPPGMTYTVVVLESGMWI